MTRAEVAALLRQFADEFESDTPGEGYEEFTRWVSTMLDLDADATLSLRTELLCWEDES